ncbi:MAG: hypothetical protein ACREOH_11800, partial [Candidatus Entotheonellia bacterium]
PSPLEGEGGDGGGNRRLFRRYRAALAISLHALADSYSHEACMKNAQFRGHKPSPPECTAIFWHLDAEYGAGGQAAGVPYTKEAGLATWLALTWFRQELELDGRRCGATLRPRRSSIRGRNAICPWRAAVWRCKSSKRSALGSDRRVDGAPGVQESPSCKALRMPGMTSAWKRSMVVSMPPSDACGEMSMCVMPRRARLPALN